MSEDERPRITAQDEDQDVEAHNKKIHGTDDRIDEGDDDFEAHKARTNIPKKN